MKSISKLNKVFDRVKYEKNYLKNKNYANHIKVCENGILISIVLSNVIPHIIKYKNSQNTATLFKKIGTDLHSFLLKEEWDKYKKSDNYNYYLNLGSKPASVQISLGGGKAVISNVEQSKNYKIEQGLSTEEFYKRLDQILGVLDESDYFKLGSDLSEIIAENSKIFEFINTETEDDRVQRIIVPSSDIDNQIIELLAVDTDKLVMICEPNK